MPMRPSDYDHTTKPRRKSMKKNLSKSATTFPETKPPSPGEEKFDVSKEISQPKRQTIKTTVKGI